MKAIHVCLSDGLKGEKSRSGLKQALQGGNEKKQIGCYRKCALTRLIVPTFKKIKEYFIQTISRKFNSPETDQWIFVVLYPDLILPENRSLKD